MHAHVAITGVILAGGQGRRLQGADKGLLELGGKPLVEHMLHRLAPQVDRMIINANRNLARYARYGVPVVEDGAAEQCGPLAGIISAMRHAETDYILTVPCDSPAPPRRYARRMLAALVQAGASVCVAHDGIRLQPVYVLLQRNLAPDLQNYLNNGGRAVHEWLRRQLHSLADFSDQPEAFLNLNTPDDYAKLKHVTESGFAVNYYGA
jgi:molybdopterin-guanine dinucleotide biosynthesis protein A